MIVLIPPAFYFLRRLKLTHYARSHTKQNEKNISGNLPRIYKSGKTMLNYKNKMCKNYRNDCYSIYDKFKFKYAHDGCMALVDKLNKCLLLLVQ